MRKLILIFSLSGILVSSAQPVKEVTVDSKVKEAKVFLNGAEEVRSATLNVKPGKNTFVLNNITPFINSESIQVTGNEAYTITGVSYRNNYLVPDSETEKQKELREKVEDMGYQLKEKNALIKIYKDEIELIEANYNLITQESGLFLDDVLEMGEMMRTRLPEIQKMIRDAENTVKTLTEQKRDAEQQLQEITEGMKRYSGEIVLHLESNRTASVSVQVRYLTTAAGWYPLYDIRSTDISSPISLTYKAMVYQSSGHDWDNVKLTLSTSNPSEGHTAPALNTWYIRPTDPNYYKQQSRSAYSRQLQSQKSNEAAAQSAITSHDIYQENQMIQMDNLRSTASYTVLQSSGVNTEFAISIPYSIPTNGKSYMVEVQKYEITPSYKYFVAPRYDIDAFLLAQISGWEKYSLLSGNATIYFKGTYVGESFVDAQSTSDTMSISLGRDKDIVVKRDKIKDFTKTATAGSSKRETTGIEIKIRNGKSRAIEIEIIDQIPVTTEKEIEITLKELGKATHTKETGELKWNLKIEPGQSSKLQFIYELKYPKSKSLSGI